MIGLHVNHNSINVSIKFNICWNQTFLDVASNDDEVSTGRTPVPDTGKESKKIAWKYVSRTFLFFSFLSFAYFLCWIIIKNPKNLQMKKTRVIWKAELTQKQVLRYFKYFLSFFIVFRIVTFIIIALPSLVCVFHYCIVGSHWMKCWLIEFSLIDMFALCFFCSNRSIEHQLETLNVPERKSMPIRKRKINTDTLKVSFLERFWFIGILGRFCSLFNTLFGEIYGRNWTKTGKNEFLF